jgi:Flp pilus assembly protein TadD
LVELTSRSGDRPGAEALITKASAQKLDRLDRANLDVERANLASDANGKIQALAHLAQLTPADTGLLRSLAAVESSQGKFSESARDWQKLASILPGSPDALNQEGYNRAWAGDLPGALRAFAEYERVRPSDPNVLDSRGDVQYLYRRFQDAAASYLAAYAKNPDFESGGDLYKAAWAQFESGDKAKAEASFAKFQTAREKTPEDLRALIQADWLYRTGRPKDAMALLRKAPASPTLSAQLAIWDLMSGDRAAAAKDMSSVTQISSGALLVAKFVSLPSATADEWRRRADQMIRGNGSEAVRGPALGYALILDGKRAAATEVWEKIVAGGPATDFFSQAVLAKLKGEKPKFALLPDPNASNQMRALVD